MTRARMHGHRVASWTVLCAVLAVNMAQEVPSIEVPPHSLPTSTLKAFASQEVEDAEVSHARSPLALALGALLDSLCYTERDS